MVGKIRTAAGGSLTGVRVAVWGLTFKGRTDDLRDSPSLAIIRRLSEEGADVVGFDPTVHEPLEGIGFSADPYGACDGAAVLAVLTDWEEFRWLDFTKVADLMATPSIVDARNLLDRNEVRRLGFQYVGIGR